VRYSDARVDDRVFRFDRFPLPGNCVGTTFENITNWRKSEQAKAGALRLLHKITVAINDSTSVADAAQLCLTEVCEQTRSDQ
jgi:hypothetical protein